MDSNQKQEIEKTVREILEESDMETTTEGQIRKLASQKLKIDLHKPEYKALVRHIVNNFLEQQRDKEKDVVEEEEEDKNKGVEYDDDGDVIVCRLSDKRRVTIQDFRGTTLVSIREFYKKDGKELPSSKGISLKEEQWAMLKKNVPAIDKAIKKMEARIG